ncbi:uncharacterized protein V6R79_007264 [Siganus canaliculatus]
MAAASSLLSEEKFLCSICLEVFTEPVSTPCGHNFCSPCIQKYWDTSDICQCPFCKRTFSSRPELQVNTIMRELASEIKKLVQVKASTPDPQFSETADVLCDICSELKEKAVKSCLICLVSFCETHLEPHQRVASLKSHKLLDPVKNLDDRMCKSHNKTSELYCKTDQAFICTLCLKNDHKGHNVIPLEEEYEAVMATKDAALTNIQEQIKSRLEKIAEIEKSADAMQRQAEKEKEAGVLVFTGLINTIQRSQAEFVEAVEERYGVVKHKAEGFVRELKMDIAELESRSKQLEQLSQSEDHRDFVQSFPKLCFPLKTDWTKVGLSDDMSFEPVRGDITQLQQRLDEIMEERLPEVKMKRMREHAVDLTFDPDTAFRTLVISQDGKQVTEMPIGQKPPSPKRFEKCSEVLTKEGFTAGKFYYEVQVKGKTGWIVGVARESVDRKNDIPLDVKNGYWTIGLDDGTYGAYDTRNVKFTLKDTLENVGIFVNYDKGQVSFYNADSKSHIYSFTYLHFTEKLYPYFCLEGDLNGKNSAPLIITPVPRSR